MKFIQSLHIHNNSISGNWVFQYPSCKTTIVTTSLNKHLIYLQMVVHFIGYQCCTGKTQVILKELCIVNQLIGKLNLISNTLQLMRQQSPILLCHGCMNWQKWRMESYLQHEIGLTVDGHALNGTAFRWFLRGDYMDSTGTGGGLDQGLVGPYYVCCLVIRTLDVHCK